MTKRSFPKKEEKKLYRNSDKENLTFYLRCIGLPLLAVILILILIAGFMVYQKQRKEKRNAIAYMALQKALQINSVDKEKSVEKQKQLELIIKEYPKTSIAVEAEFELANSAFSLGNYRQASERFSAFYTRHSKHDFLSDPARLLLGKCALALENYTEAKERFLEIAESSTDLDIRNQAKYLAALSLSFLGNKESAKKITNELLMQSQEEDPITAKARFLLNMLSQ